MRTTHLFLIILTLLWTCDEKREFNNPVASGTILEAPTGLSATQDGEWIKLTWPKDNRVTGGWKIERKTGSGDFTEIAHLDNAAILTFTDTTITTDVAYEYRIKGYSDENETPYSAPKVFTASFPVPTELTATPLTDVVMRLSWKDNCSFEKGFILERKHEQDDFAEIKRLPTSTTTANDSGLTYGASYQYRIRAFTEHNQSGLSNVVTKSTVFPAPSGLVSEAITDTEIRLTWADNCVYESGYRIERSDDGTTFTQVGEVVSNITEFTDGNLTYGDEYTYRIYGFTGKNQSGYSNVVTKSTIFPAPGSLAAEAIRILKSD